MPRKKSLTKRLENHLFINYETFLRKKRDCSCAIVRDLYALYAKERELVCSIKNLEKVMKEPRRYEVVEILKLEN